MLSQNIAQIVGQLDFAYKCIPSVSCISVRQALTLPVGGTKCS